MRSKKKISSPKPHNFLYIVYIVFSYVHKMRDKYKEILCIGAMLSRERSAPTPGQLSQAGGRRQADTWHRSGQPSLAGLSEHKFVCQLKSDPSSKTAVPLLISSKKGPCCLLIYLAAHIRAHQFGPAVYKNITEFNEIENSSPYNGEDGAD